MKCIKDKYGRGSAAVNGAEFVDLEPGDTFSGLEVKLCARIADVYFNERLGISATIGSKRNANELSQHMAPGEDEEALEINQDACSERTPRGAISEDLNSAPLQNLASSLESSIAYYVGDVNRTNPRFIGCDEAFTIEGAAEKIAGFLL